VLSVTVTVATRTPGAVGVNETETEQLAPGLNDVGPTGQLLVMLKSPGFAPANTGAAKTALPVPMSYRVNELLAVAPRSVTPKVIFVTDCETVCVTASPVPRMGTLCGFPGALSFTRRFAARGPGAVGLKAMVTLHVAFSASEVQVFAVTVKSDALGPVSWTLAMETEAVPTFSN
jgi:hypothetical protein